MGRRARGEGSVYFDKSKGLWVGQVDFGYRNGKRWLRKATGKTEQIALARRDALLAELRRGAALDSGDVERLTVEAWLNAWLRDVVAVERTPKTLRGYSDHVRLHIVPSIGHLRLVRLAPQHVQLMIRGMAAEGLAPSTIAGARKVLAAALAVAIQWWPAVIQHNVAQLVQGPRITPVRSKRALTVTEATALLAVTRQHRLGALYAVSIGTGLRQGEALGLRWEDVDFDAGTLAVRVKLGTATRELEDPKTRAGSRLMFMPDFVSAALREHRQPQRLERMAIGPRWRESDLVFTSSLGTPLSARNVLRVFQEQHLPAAGITKVTWHDLRRTHSTLLAHGRVPPQVMKAVMGHSSISVTMDVYTDVVPEDLRTAADAMNAIFN